METVEKVRTIIHTDIPTAGVFGRGYAWHHIKGCNNESCFLHPVHTGGCWAAEMCNRMAGPWAKYENEYLNCKWDIYYQVELENDLKNFKPRWFRSQFQKKFPKKRSCILVGYMADIAFVPREWVERILKRITQDNQERESAGLPLHVFHFLTKNPREVYVDFNGAFPQNCWLGITARNQRELEGRADNFNNPFNLRYFYLEPLVSKVNLQYFMGLSSFDGKTWARGTGSSIDWVIVGGQSGKNAQPLNPEWVRSIRDQCVAAGIPFYFKGWGDNIFFLDRYWSKREFRSMKKSSNAGYTYPIFENEIDGATWEQFPEVSK